MGQYKITKSEQKKVDGGFEILGLNFEFTNDGKKFQKNVDRIVFEFPKLYDPKRLEEQKRYNFLSTKFAEMEKIKNELIALDPSYKNIGREGINKVDRKKLDKELEDLNTLLQKQRKSV